MSEEYAGKSNEQIIQEQAASLSSKDSNFTKDKYNPRNTVLSEQSGVNESGLGEFPGADVQVGRTGQTGGGTNPQLIPPEEGGSSKAQSLGQSSDQFESTAGGPEDAAYERLANNPGGFDAAPRGVDQIREPATGAEPVPRTEDQALEPDQEATARNPTGI
ncbi:hypothetical protein IE81DRAFT_298185 [Ceraceosorus guamensis]|uniref:Uncharacterized protein n=1 Tax=Ceraceosorus guamensis TaxID=1522189 RepID=A0A316W8H8_9BASI|nr:hypothetical protein IE81DRAFT_298185 [Ceraceosorus guamensis]PWN45061.1 hypothetical protein IE81DRAFT_298185 [Ceraceosorus guamensis]